MARKVSVTKEMIYSAAVELACEEGLDSVSARTLAQKAGCSTQPIFRVYASMDELLKEVYPSLMKKFSTYFDSFDKTSETPFVNLGLAYISFAQESPKMFKSLFLSENRFGYTLYDVLNGENGAVVKEINAAKSYGCKDPGGLFMKMWMLIHGAACMSLTGDYDLGKDETAELLISCYKSFAG